MKKILSILLSIPLLFSASVVLAHEGEATDATTEALEQETEGITSTLPSPGITPDSPFYFLDTLGENIGLFFARSDDIKAKKAFSYAEEKLAEAKDMADKGKEKAADNATKRYDGYVSKATENLDKAKAAGKDVDELAAKVAEATLKHEAVLAGVYDKLLANGNETAAEAVKKAMENSLNGHDKALQAITNNGQRKSELESKGQSVRSKVEEKMKGPTGTTPQ